MHRCFEVERFRNVDTSGPRLLGAEYSRDEDAVRDALLERRRGRMRFIEVNRIEVARDPGLCDL